DRTPGRRRGHRARHRIPGVRRRGFHDRIGNGGRRRADCSVSANLALPVECASCNAAGARPGEVPASNYGRRTTSMFPHVMVGGNDIDASKKFYDAVLGAMGHSEGKLDAKGRVWYRTKTGSFSVTKPIDGNAASHANGGTIGFLC